MTPADLHRLATAHGVATSYRDERQRLMQVHPDVVIRVLALLLVDAGSPAARDASGLPSGFAWP